MAEDDHAAPPVNPEGQMPVQGAGANQAQEKKEPKKSTLESIIGETNHFFGSAAKLGLAAAAPYGLYKIAPQWALDTAIDSGAQVLGDATTSFKKGKKFTAGNVLESSVLGTMYTPVLEKLVGGSYK